MLNLYMSSYLHITISIDHASRSTAGASLCIDLLGVWLEDLDKDHRIEHDVLVLNSQNHVGPSREIVKFFVDHIFFVFLSAPTKDLCTKQGSKGAWKRL